MSLEIGRNVTLRVATAGIGAAFLLSGLGNVADETLTDKNITGPKNQPSEHLIPVPCAETMPWEPPTKDKSNQIGEASLVSIKIPDPIPNRNQPECWQIIRNSGTIFPQPSEL